VRLVLMEIRDMLTMVCGVWPVCCHRDHLRRFVLISKVPGGENWLACGWDHEEK